MIWDRIRGHGSRVEWFRRTIRRGRLSHGYVFAGPEGIGKQLFARTLAQCLFCQRHSNAELLACGECSACKQVKAGTHPDLHEVGPMSTKSSELKIEQFVGEGDSRGKEGLCYELSRLPMAADRKIAIINDATGMNQSAANAFLKTLEEPQVNALVVLIADNLDALLPTIRSRCQTVRFDALSAPDLSQLLIELDWVKDPHEAAALAQLSSGSLAVASQLLDPALRELRDGMYDDLANPQFNSLALAERLTTGLEAIGGESAAQRRNAGWLVRFALEFFRSALLSLTDPSQQGLIPAAVKFARKFEAGTAEDHEFLMRLFERVAETERHIDANISVPRCLEVLCDELGRQLRPAGR